MQNFNEMEAQKCAFERSAAQALRLINAQQAEFELMKKRWAANQIHEQEAALSHRSQEEVKVDVQNVVEVRRAVD